MILISTEKEDKTAVISLISQLILDDSCKQIAILNELDVENDIKPIKKNKPIRKESIEKILDDLGMPRKLIGYRFVVDSIRLMVNKNVSKCQITKEIYPVVAFKNNTTAHKVERNIGNAIEMMYLKGDLRKIETIFKQSYQYRIGRPSNFEFIYTLSEKIRGSKNEDSN